MDKEQKKSLFEIIISAAMLAVIYFLPAWRIKPFLYLLPYLTAGYGVLKEAVENIFGGEIFDENFLMSLATVGAFAVGESPEAVFVMLFFRVGELFEDIAVGNSKKSISAVIGLRPDFAAVEYDGRTENVSPDSVTVGSTVVVKPGEKIPLDGTVISGSGSIDASALTGESLPAEVSEGCAVFGGCVNLSGVIRVRVDKPYSESTTAKIIGLIENSASLKAKSEGFITRFARYYTPAVVLSALILAFIPPIFAGNLTDWIYRALNFLVISCPCALVVSVPLSFFSGIGRASKAGILVKGSCYLERLADAGTFVFDKTGTLTEGRFSVSGVCPVNTDGAELLEIAASCEKFSLHPIAKAIFEAADGIYENASDIKELAGYGISGKLGEYEIFCGNAKLMSKLGLSVPDGASETSVHVAQKDGERTGYLGYITVSDTVKSNASQALSALRGEGVGKTVMLTGDVPAAAEAVGASLGIDRVRAGLLPADKVAEVEALISGSDGSAVVFVGDGINDAPVLTRADVGIAMGALGSDAAIDAADIVIMDDDLGKLPRAVGIARVTVSRVRQNVVFSILVKLVILCLSSLGLCSMPLAVFADVGVLILAVLNALR